MMGFDRTYEGLKRKPGREGHPHGPGFDRTYEGLKLRLQATPPIATTQSFDRTYEGLKRTPCAVITLPVPGFDRTYEGLKRLLGLFSFLHRASVLTVPMRV